MHSSCILATALQTISGHKHILFKSLHSGSVADSNGSMPEVEGVCTQMCSSGVDLFLVTLSARISAFLRSPTPIVGGINLSFLDSWSESVSLLYSCSVVVVHWLERLESQAVYLEDNVKFRKIFSIHGQEGRISLVGINAETCRDYFPWGCVPLAWSWATAQCWSAIVLAILSSG